jgi:hypothetical protein
MEPDMKRSIAAVITATLLAGPLAAQGYPANGSKAARALARVVFGVPLRIMPAISLARVAIKTFT